MIPWNERVPMISINPEAATRDDIARMAAELVDIQHKAVEELERPEAVNTMNDFPEARPVSLSALLARTREQKERIDKVLSWELEDYVRDELTDAANVLENIEVGLKCIIGM